MIYLCLIASLITTAAVEAEAQANKKRDWLLFMPVQALAEANLKSEELKTLRLVLRGQTVNQFEEKGIATISPVQIKLSETQHGFDLEKIAGWDKGVIDRLVERWTPRYVALVTIQKLESVEGSAVSGGVPPPPGGSLTTTAIVRGSLYDTKTAKYVIEDVEKKVVLKQGRPGPSQKQVDDQNLKAAMEATSAIFKDFLKKLPKPTKYGIDG